MHLQEQGIHCPYCGEGITILLDAEESGQEYTEDCQVCCRPILMNLMLDGGELVAIPRREDE